MSDMRIAVLGAAGRMGQALTRALHATPGCEVAGGLETAGSPLIGRDLGEVVVLGDDCRSQALLETRQIARHRGQHGQRTRINHRRKLTAER